MKRTLIRLTATLVAFTIGLAVEFIISDQHLARHPATQKTVHAQPTIDVPPSQLSSTPEVIAFGVNYDPKGFNPRGDYYIIGHKPQGFRDFDCLEIAVDDDEATGVISLYTYAEESQTSYSVVSGSITNGGLAFVATPSPHNDGEFVYSFEGRFVKSGTLSEVPEGMPVLTGKLTKSKNGVKVAESEVKFRVEYLGC